MRTRDATQVPQSTSKIVAKMITVLSIDQESYGSNQNWEVERYCTLLRPNVHAMPHVTHIPASSITEPRPLQVEVGLD